MVKEGSSNIVRLNNKIMEDKIELTKSEKRMKRR
jgi:hypothetical protein